MDRFQVLFEIYRKNIEEFNSYQEESLKFLMGYLDSYLEFFSLKPKNAIIYSWDEPPAPTRDPLKAMKLMTDSFWHVRMGMILKVPRVDLPEQVLVFEMLFKKYKGNFIMKLGNDPSIQIPFQNGKWFYYEFNKSLYEFLVDFYQNDMEKFLDQPESNKLGFNYPMHN
ncbi:MAG: hypothetical protein H6539_02075 [Bacteroidales bacterium]|nr:hypothetical protein [Bacteroidales bacterium]